MRLALLALLAGCATTHKIDRAADSVSAVAASIERVAEELAPSPLTPQQASEPPPKPTTPLAAAIAAAPTVIVNVIVNVVAIYHAAASVWAAMKTMHHEPQPRSSP